ncbi:MAG: LysM peptidoglycan-binding domain-containing protein [Candidatus Marinimicrobia bacterium]|nr:LysM peptidoglycan-binding domain-containing protein [Candidatus Neomarinimicrobiota bacterium]MCF7830176.1 LysM peptidoglycan-binding domain-containing protein [Candidatus Neomarinimicrobiota bacterium]MCF7882090.1 LysM peptidoglycan-binding domain-containing protein [Candidatus Neomarinimicrobiota bacterium]
MKSITNGILLFSGVLLLVGWFGCSQNQMANEDNNREYTVAGYVYSQSHIPVSNVNVRLINWGQAYSTTTDSAGFFMLEFSVSRQDTIYNKQVALVLGTSDAQYQSRKLTVSIREFDNQRYVFEDIPLHYALRRQEPSAPTAMNWAKLDSLQHRIDSLRAVMEKYPALVDSLESVIAGLQTERDQYFERYVVKEGDFLAKIAADSSFYKDPEQWKAIYNANREIIDNPDLIYPDQILKIPMESPAE